MSSIREVTAEQAVAIFGEYGLRPVFAVGSSSTVTGAYQALVCDYRTLAGYDVAFACSIHKGPQGFLVERFNIMKKR